MPSLLPQDVLELEDSLRLYEEGELDLKDLDPLLQEIVREELRGVEASLRSYEGGLPIERLDPRLQDVLREVQGSAIRKRVASSVRRASRFFEPSQRVRPYTPNRLFGGKAVANAFVIGRVKFHRPLWEISEWKRALSGG